MLSPPPKPASNAGYGAYFWVDPASTPLLTITAQPHHWSINAAMFAGPGEAVLGAAVCSVMFFSIPASLNLGQRRRKKEGWRVLKLAYGILRALHDGIGGPMLYTLR